MKLISIDSTSEIIHFGYYDSTSGIFIKTENSGLKKSSDEIIAVFQELIKKSKTDISNIDGFVCLTGPGSFTGIRLGLAFIEGLASGLKSQNKEIKTIPITLFQAYLITKKNEFQISENVSVQIKSNNPETIFIQDFNAKTLQEITPPREVFSKDFQTENKTITDENTYNIETVLKYICDNIEIFSETENIIPCYVRQHYGKPKSYLIRENISETLKKIIISNEEKSFGFIEYQTAERTSEITDFEIEKLYRGVGAGKFLLKKFIEKMQQNGFEKIILDVRSKNIIAKKLYEKFGFTQDGIRKNYYTTNEPDDAILMSLKLN